MTAASPRSVPPKEPVHQNGSSHTQSSTNGYHQQQQQQYRGSYTDRNNPDSDNSTQRFNQSNNKDNMSIRDHRYSHPSYDSDPNLDPSQHHPASSSRQQHQQSGPQEDFLQPLSATPPHTDSEKDKHSHRNRHGNHGNQHKHDEDSGIAGFTPETYRENDQLDR